MGVSVSWHQDEYDALGVPFHERGQVLESRQPSAISSNPLKADR